MITVWHCVCGAVVQWSAVHELSVTVLALGLVATVLDGGSGPSPVQAIAPEITLITHDPGGQLRPEDSCASKGCQALVGLIDGAQTSIDFAIYGARRQSEILCPAHL